MCPLAFHITHCIHVYVRSLLFARCPLFIVCIYAWKLSCVINIIRPNLSYCVCIFDSRLFQRLLILVNDKPIAGYCWQNKINNSNNNGRTKLNASCFSLSHRIQCYLYTKQNHIIPIYFEERKNGTQRLCAYVRASVRADDVLFLS